MKRILCVIILFGALFAVSCGPFFGANGFKEPKVVTGVLPNGMRYYLLPDHELPIVRMSVITRTGSIYEPADRLGLANLLGILLRTGGTKDMSPEEVDRTFDNMAAEAGASIGLEMGESAIKVLSKDADRAFEVFFGLLFSPRLDSRRVELGKIKIIEALKRENDYPDQVVVREFKKLVYGDMSPWARRPTPETVGALKIEDLKEFHKKYFVPSNMILAAAGNFEPSAFIETIKKYTGNVPDHRIEFPNVAPVELEFRPKERVIERPLTQTYIEMGHLGIKRHNPDKYALEIMDTILGAPVFKSRLMEDIRSNRGLAYTVASDFGWGTDYGLFSVYVDTKAQTAGQVVELVREHIVRLQGAGDITKTELDFAKRTTLNRLIFEFDNSFKIVSQRARYHFYGYPDDYWHVYRREIEKVGVEDVKRVAKKYLHPDGLSIAIVGSVAK